MSHILSHTLSYTLSYTLPHNVTHKRDPQTLYPNQLFPTTFAHSLPSRAVLSRALPSSRSSLSRLALHVPPFVSHPSLLALAIYPQERGSRTCPRGDAAERGHDQVHGRPQGDERRFWVVPRGGWVVLPPVHLTLPEKVRCTDPKVFPPIRLHGPAGGF